MLAGKSGAISYVPPLTDLYGASVEMAVLLSATKRWRERFAVRVSCQVLRYADACNSDWTVTDAVTVGVGIERVRAGVRAVDVVASAGFNTVVKTVAIVVAVSDKTRCWSWSAAS
jgi:hypothetical protein